MLSLAGCRQNPSVMKKSPVLQEGSKWRSQDETIYFEVYETGWANGTILTGDGKIVKCKISGDIVPNLYLYVESVLEDSAINPEDECYEKWKCCFVSKDKFIVTEIEKTTFFSKNVELMFEKTEG